MHELDPTVVTINAVLDESVAIGRAVFLRELPTHYSSNRKPLSPLGRHIVCPVHECADPPQLGEGHRGTAPGFWGMFELIDA